MEKVPAFLDCDYVKTKKDNGGLDGQSDWEPDWESVENMSLKG